MWSDMPMCGATTCVLQGCCCRPGLGYCSPWWERWCSNGIRGAMLLVPSGQSHQPQSQLPLEMLLSACWLGNVYSCAQRVFFIKYIAELPPPRFAKGCSLVGPDSSTTASRMSLTHEFPITKVSQLSLQHETNFNWISSNVLTRDPVL